MTFPSYTSNYSPRVSSLQGLELPLTRDLTGSFRRTSSILTLTRNSRPLFTGSSLPENLPSASSLPPSFLRRSVAGLTRPHTPCEYLLVRFLQTSPRTYSPVPEFTVDSLRLQSTTSLSSNVPILHENLWNPRPPTPVLDRLR